MLMKEENQKEPEKQVEIEESIEFKNKDVRSKFEFWCNYISSDPIKRYDAKRKSIEHGKELLPWNLENVEEQEKVQKIYNDACKILKEEIPNQRHSEFDYFDEGGKRYPIIRITSKDAGECTTTETEYKKTLEDFILQQYEQHMGKLQDAFDKIYHMLVKYDIVKKEDKSPDELVADWIKEKITEKKQKTKNKEVKKDASNKI